jgi:hypothetical protein
LGFLWDVQVFEVLGLLGLNVDLLRVFLGILLIGMLLRKYRRHMVLMIEVM